MKPLLVALSLCALLCPAVALADPLPALPPRATAAPTATTHGAAAVEVVVSDGVVNINEAAPEELVRVPGIGPARADAIVHLRERVHRFRHVDDLLRVRGIGRLTLRRMRPYLATEGATTLETRPRRPRLGVNP